MAPYKITNFLLILIITNNINNALDIQMLLINDTFWNTVFKQDTFTWH